MRIRLNDVNRTYRRFLLCAGMLTVMVSPVQAQTPVAEAPLSPLTRKATAFGSYRQSADPAIIIPPVRVVAKGGTSYRLIADIPYLGNDYPETADLYLPVADEGSRVPALLDIHGGGWLIGDKSWQRENAEALVMRGMAVFTINYKLGSRPKGGRVTDEGGWPRNLMDCKTALRFMRAYARELQIDSSRIAVCGQSAGGHLALLTGLTANRSEYRGGFYQGQAEEVCAIINFYGVTDLRVWGRDMLFSEWDRRDDKVLSLASPVDQVHSNSPPVLTIHGDADTLVSISHAKALDEALKRTGAEHQFIILEGIKHGFKIRSNKKFENRDLTDEVIRFLEKAGFFTSN